MIALCRKQLWKMAAMRLALSACLVWLALEPARADLADPTTLLINRNGAALSVYLRVPATGMEDLLGLAPGAFWQARESLDYGQLQTRLTAEAPRIWRALGLQVEAVNPSPEVIGALIHPNALPLDFTAPFAASVALAVCATPRAQVAPVAELTFFAGYVLRGVGPRAALSWAPAGAAPGVVDVQFFDNGAPVGARQLTPVPHQRAALEAPAPDGPPPEAQRLKWGLFLVALLGLASFAAGRWLLRRR